MKAYMYKFEQMETLPEEYSLHPYMNHRRANNPIWKALKIIMDTPMAYMMIGDCSTYNFYLYNSRKHGLLIVYRGIFSGHIGFYSTTRENVAKQVERNRMSVDEYMRRVAYEYTPALRSSPKPDFPIVAFTVNRAELESYLAASTIDLFEKEQRFAFRLGSSSGYDFYLVRVLTYRMGNRIEYLMMIYHNPNIDEDNVDSHGKEYGGFEVTREELDEYLM